MTNPKTGTKIITLVDDMQHNLSKRIASAVMLKVNALKYQSKISNPVFTGDVSFHQRSNVVRYNMTFDFDGTWGNDPPTHAMIKGVIERWWQNEWKHCFGDAVICHIEGTGVYVMEKARVTVGLVFRKNHNVRGDGILILFPEADPCRQKPALSDEEFKDRYWEFFGDVTRTLQEMIGVSSIDTNRGVIGRTTQGGGTRVNIWTAFVELQGECQYIEMLGKVGEQKEAVNTFLRDAGSNKRICSKLEVHSINDINVRVYRLLVWTIAT